MSSSSTSCNVCLVNNLGVQSLEEGCMDQAIHYFKTALMQIKQEQEAPLAAISKQYEYSSPSTSCWNEIQECLVPSRTNGQHGAQRTKEEEGAFSSSTMFSRGIRLPSFTTLCLSQAASIVIYNLALAVHIRGGNNVATKKAAALYQRAHQAIGACYDSSHARGTDDAQQCLLDMTSLAILNNWSLLVVDHRNEQDSDVHVLFQRQVRTVQGRSYWRCAGPASNSAPLQAMFQGFLWNATVQRILTQNTAAAA